MNKKMGTATNNPHSRFIGIRLTESEFIQLQAQMKDNDYTSMSRYIRDRTLNRTARISRNVSLCDKDMMDKINGISAQIAKIGVNYNQATKKFNTLCETRHPDGTPVINSRAANYYLHQLQEMTRELKEMMNRVINTVDSMHFSEGQTEYNV